MYQYQNNILSIPAKLLYEEWGIMSYQTYKSYCTRGKLIRTKEGRGKGNEAWVSFYDLENKIKELCVKFLGKPSEVVIVNDLEKYIVPDKEAINFYASHRTPSGRPLSLEKQREKATNAMILNAIRDILTDPKLLKANFGAKKALIWQNISNAVNALSPEKWLYSLPGNQRSLKRRYKKYLDESYAAFIHKNEGSANAKKVTDELENLIISLYCLPNKPYTSSVHDLYMQFLGGGIDVVDYKTGEVFDRENYYQNGVPVTISESTVWNYLRDPKNELIIKKYRNGSYDFSQKQRPHLHRTPPQYSMSKISLDDRDIMHTKLPSGERVMAYYAFDDLSGAMIGIAHSKSKTHDLFLDCIRDMFRFTTSKGLGVPMQVEVEHHLVRDFRDGLMKAGSIFPFVRWCNPTNSQEKYAETQIRTKKYGVEKRNNQNVGRHYNRLDSNRITRQKIFDAANDNYKTAKASFDQIVNNELQEQIEYNNELHPNQKKYKGMTRLDVFLHHVNPNLPALDKAQLAKYIGCKVQTSIRRSQYVTVQYEKYQLSSPEVLERLAPNNYNVEAYYLPNESNDITEVYVYQHDHFICECKPVPKFNRANAEWTESDQQAYQEGRAYVSSFDKMVKEDTKEHLHNLEIIKKQETTLEHQQEEFPVILEDIDHEEEFLLDSDNNDESIRERAFNNL